MKGFVIALIIFIFLTVTLMFYNIYINKTFTDLVSRTAMIENSIYEEKYINAKISALLLKRKLEKDSSVLYIITERSSIDNALTECSKLLCFIEVFDKAEAYATASGIKSIIEKANEKSALFTDKK